MFSTQAAASFNCAAWARVSQQAWFCSTVTSNYENCGNSLTTANGDVLWFTHAALALPNHNIRFALAIIAPNLDKLLNKFKLLTLQAEVNKKLIFL